MNTDHNNDSTSTTRNRERLPGWAGGRLAANGFTVGLREPGAHLFDFTSTRDVFVFNLAGPGSYDFAFNGGPKHQGVSSSGTMNFHPAGSDVFIRNHRADLRLLVIRAPVSLRYGYTEVMDVEGDIENRMNIAGPGVVAASTLARRFLESGFPGGTMMAEALGVAALGEVFGYHRGAEPDAEGTLDRRALRRVLDLIEQDLGDVLTVQILADEAGLSVSHFSRRFRDSIGETPALYVHRRRLERARELLRTTRQSIAHIALACGFCSQSHLTDAFRRWQGVTPALYRRTAGE
ncbi:MAG: AraC family transcriptional regulator [Pseudomonadota bacterium]